jgi:transposase
MNTRKNNGKIITIKAYSKKELTAMYNVSSKTMTRWLKPHLEKIGKREGHYYNVRQVELIFGIFGLPDCLYHAA